jgi:transcriptional regulator with XRE-family HTH domain
MDMVASSTTDNVNLDLTLQDALYGNEFLVIQKRLKSKTLEEIGQELGVTRQRISQIEKKAIRYLRVRPVRQDLERGLKGIINCLSDMGEVVTAEEASMALLERGIISGVVFNDFSSIKLLSQWMGVDLGYRIHDDYRDFLVTDAGYEQLQSHEDESLRLVFILHRVMQKTCGVISSQNPVIAAIASESEIASLFEGGIGNISLFSAEGSSWLSIAQGRFHISTQAKKIFSVCDKVKIELLSRQLERSLKVKKYEGRNEISIPVIEEWIKTCGLFEIVDDVVSCVGYEQLSDAERIVINMLNEREKWLYTDLLDSLEGDITKESLTKVLQFCPLVVCDKSGGRRNYTYSLLNSCVDSSLDSIAGAAKWKPEGPAYGVSEIIENLDVARMLTGVVEVEKRNIESSEYYRDPEVTQWILGNSAGTCECCLKKAPFNRPNGLPYLEVHHVKMLSEGGSDTIQNAIAVCPNCHKEFHHGERRSFLQSDVYTRVKRLIRE